MYEIYLVFRSITYAQRGQSVLNRRGIPSNLGRSPAQISKNGCAYALRLRFSDAKRAAWVLEDERVPFSSIYRYRNGQYEVFSP